VTLRRAVLPMILIAACSQSPEAANTAEQANETTAATPAKMVTGMEEKSPAKTYADATAA
jgi:hypothetical protein